MMGSTMKRGILPILMLLCITCLFACGKSNIGEAPVAPATDIAIALPAVDEQTEQAIAKLHNEMWNSLRAGHAPDSVIPLAQKEMTLAVQEATHEEAVEQDGLLPDAFVPEKELSQISLRMLAQEELVPVAQYHITFGKTGTIPLKVETPEEAPFWFFLTPYRTEMYVVFSKVPQGQAEYLVMTSYAKQGDTWQQYEVKSAPYAYREHNAPSLFLQAQQAEESDAFLIAAAYAHAAGTVLHPCGIAYKNEAEMTQEIPLMLDKITQEKLFPATLAIEKPFKTRLTLIGADPVFTVEQGVTLNLRYVTSQNNRLLSLRQTENQTQFTTSELRSMKRAQKVLLAQAQSVLTTQAPLVSGLADSFSGVFFTSHYNLRPNQAKTSQEDFSQYVIYAVCVEEVNEA